MYYEEQSKSTLLSPLTGYFLWAFLPKEHRGKMGWFCMLRKHVYFRSLQHCVLDKATSAPAPAPAPSRPPSSCPMARAPDLHSSQHWVTVKHSSQAPFRIREINFKDVVLSQMMLLGLSLMVTLSESTGLTERGILELCEFCCADKREKRPPRLSLALCSISLFTDGLTLQNGFSHWLISQCKWVMVLNSNHTYFLFSPWSCSSLVFCSERTFPPASICNTIALEGLHYPYFYNQLWGGHLSQNVGIYLLFFLSLLLYYLKRLWRVDLCSSVTHVFTKE